MTSSILHKDQNQKRILIAPKVKLKYEKRKKKIWFMNHADVHIL